MCGERDTRPLYLFRSQCGHAGYTSLGFAAFFVSLIGTLGMCGQAELVGVAGANTSALKSLVTTLSSWTRIGDIFLASANSSKPSLGGEERLVGPPSLWKHFYSRNFPYLSTLAAFGCFLLGFSEVEKGTVGLFRPCMLTCKLSQSVHKNQKYPTALKND